MITERFLYFRSSATLTDDHDQSGSTIYPASAFRGACSGDAALGGVVTDDDDRLSLFFTPKAVVPAGAPDATVNADGDHCDIVVLDLTTVNTQKAALTDLVNKIYGQPHLNGLIDVFDAVTGNGITGVSGIHVIEHKTATD
jgi:hypothetical protein